MFMHIYYLLYIES